MSRKISPLAKFTIFLTIFGGVIPTIYMNSFSEGFLRYHSSSTLLFANIGRLLCCIIGIVIVTSIS